MTNEYVLEVKGLNKTYGKKRVLNNISLNVKHNEIVGFIGPNGAGKSTTMKCICNLVFPDSGEIIINGYDLFKEREKALEVQAAETIVSDSIRFEVQNQDILSEILYKLLSKKIKVYDIYKDNIDIEAIYKEIYSKDYKP